MCGVTGWVDFEPNLGWGVQNPDEVAREDTDVD